MKKLLTLKFLGIATIVFVVLFLMNYIGNTQPNKTENAALVGFGGVMGLTLWKIFFNKTKDEDPPENFD